MMRSLLVMDELAREQIDLFAQRGGQPLRQRRRVVFHPFGREEPVSRRENAPGAPGVARSKLEEVEVLVTLVLHQLEELDHIVQFIHGEGPSLHHRALSLRKAPEERRSGHRRDRPPARSLT